jgi:hypothetical protein
MVSYNSAGDPAAILPNPVSSDPEFNAIYFRYDRFGRLRDVIFVYPGGTNIAAIDIWQRFNYPRPGLVIDSFLNYDGPGVPLGPSFTLPADPPPYVTAIIRGYEQDKQGRTVRRWIVSPNSVGPPQPVDTIAITYDGKGNQIRPGIGYDDKINIYRTNKVWQLLFQDYSTNNPVTFSTEFPISVITAYNRWGLPKDYMDNEREPMGDIFFYEYGSVQVSYSCDGSSEGRGANRVGAARWKAVNCPVLAFIWLIYLESRVEFSVCDLHAVAGRGSVIQYPAERAADRLTKGIVRRDRQDCMPTDTKQGGIGCPRFVVRIADTRI